MRFNLFGKTIQTGSTKEVEKHDADYDRLQADFNFMIEQNMTYKAGDNQWSPVTERPVLTDALLSTDSGAKVPLAEYPMMALFNMVKNIDALRLCIDTLNREYHRNGLEIVPKYQYKCKNCKKEFQAKPTTGVRFMGESSEKEELKCDSCGGTKFELPNPKKRKILMDLLKKKVNNNRQRFKTISKQIARDLDIADFACILLLKKYRKDSKNVLKSQLDEIIRVNPAQVFIIANFEGRIGFDEKDRRVFFCPRHRHGERVYKTTDDDANPKCRIKNCGLTCLPAAVEVNSMYQNISVGDSKRMLYGDNEVIMIHGKYWPDQLYGYSNIYTLWSKAMALSHMDEYVRKYFDKMRPPRGLLVVGSRNNQSMQKSFDEMKLKMKNDPYNINPLMVESERGARAMVEYIDLTGSLQDLQFIDVREEFRRTIGAIYGISNVFDGNSQGLQQGNIEMMVTNRAIEYGQEVLKEELYEPLCEALGVHDWVVQLKSGEETDIMRDLQTEAQAISNANGMFGMGFGVEKDADNNFIFSQRPLREIGSENMPQKSPAPKGEEMTQYEGEPYHARPSDQGGIAEGMPASGDHTSQTRKSDIQKKKKENWITVNDTPVNVSDWGDSKDEAVRNFIHAKESERNKKPPQKKPNSLNIKGKIKIPKNVSPKNAKVILNTLQKLNPDHVKNIQDINLKKTTKSENFFGRSRPNPFHKTDVSGVYYPTNDNMGITVGENASVGKMKHIVTHEVGHVTWTHTRTNKQVSEFGKLIKRIGSLTPYANLYVGENFNLEYALKETVGEKAKMLKGYISKGEVRPELIYGESYTDMKEVIDYYKDDTFSMKDPEIRKKVDLYKKEVAKYDKAFKAMSQKERVARLKEFHGALLNVMKSSKDRLNVWYNENHSELYAYMQDKEGTILQIKENMKRFSDKYEDDDTTVEEYVKRLEMAARKYKEIFPDD